MQSAHIRAPCHHIDLSPDAAPPADVIVAHDGSGIEQAALALLRRPYRVEEADLRGEVAAPSGKVLAIVICIDLTNPASIRAVREHYIEHAIQIPRIFVLPSFNRRTIVQAYSAGAHQLLAAPLTYKSLKEALAPLMDRSVVSLWGNLSDMQQSALKISLKLFEDSHTAVLRGDGLETQTVTRACSSIITAVGHDGFPALLEALRSHHNYTFRHSMYVTGALVAFADALGFREDDIGRAAMAGLLHDVGKIVTPNGILDKPAKLDAAELSIMQHHASEGGDILLRNGDWPDDVMDAVMHHHERLDGTGYGDHLAGEQITDLTRMVSIADMFSALIDKRAYKPAMPGKDALAIMKNARGHLDQDLVAAFEPVALAIG